MKHQNVKLIIVPDVHGRIFWKDIFDYDCDVVFLGDYLDPYPGEGIYPWDALENFVQILTYAEAHPKVTLLYGNHDLGYVLGRHVCSNRSDYVNYEVIRSHFLDHEHLFQLAYDYEQNNRKFFVSHAGISYGWYLQHRDLFPLSYPDTLSAKYLNELYRDGKLNPFLGEFGSKRGGRTPFGSIVWADSSDFSSAVQVQSDIIQIVGHTCHRNGARNLEGSLRLYLVDSLSCIYIDDLGALRLLADGSLISPSDR